MAICWWCYWGWPKEIADIFDRGEAAAGYSAMRFGPAHVVWEDENWDSAQWCLDHFDEYAEDLDEEQRQSVRQSLEDLKALPDEFKQEPEGFDDENPAQYPPPKHWVMVRR